MKQFFTLCLLFSTAVSVYAQDIIIKEDKSELKSKVLEVEEFNVKYKLFDFQDGPTYNIKKSEVFMIIYSNGRRETFETSASIPVVSNTEYTAPAAKNLTEQKSSVSGTLMQSQNVSDEEAVNYKPLKLLAYTGGVSVSSAGTDANASTYILEVSGEAPLFKLL